MTLGAKPYYPLLFALHSPLALAVANVGGGVTAGELLRPLGWAVLFASVGWCVGLLVSRDLHRRAMVAAIVVAYLSYGGGVLTGPLRTKGLWEAAGIQPAIALIPLTALLAIVLLASTHRDLRGATRFLNLATVVLFAFLGFGAARSVLASVAMPRHAIANAPAAPSGPLGERPDIYFIVLDSYSSGRALAAQYGHDNSGFEAALRARGFVVPTAARANYPATHLALAAALNWTYLDELARRQGPESRNRGRTYEMIERSRAHAFLKAQGYRLVFFPTSYAGTTRNRAADSVIGRRGASEFESVWFTRTALTYVGRLCGSSGGMCARSEWPFEAEGAAAMRRKMDQVAVLPRMQGPKLVIAHLMIPHEPFVFRSDCSTRESYWPRAATEDREWRAAYAEQVACVNRLLLPVVDSLIAGSRVPPIVILQGDHGHGRFPLGRVPPLSEISREQIEDRTHVFAAYHMPKVPPAMISDSISPVNVWPLLLTHHFATPTTALPDETYWSTYRRPYDFTRLH